MKKSYIVNKQLRNGKHEVHAVKECDHLPEPQNREPLGDHDDCEDAVLSAKLKGYVPANGCYWCSRPCN